MKKLFVLNGGVWITVSDIDYLAVLNLGLRIDSHGNRAPRVLISSPSNLHGQQLHVWIAKRAGLDTSITIDHRDGDPLNNVRENLRPASLIDQQHNRKLTSNNTSGFKGVHTRSNGTFEVKIKFKGKRVNLGTYYNVEEAARVYDDAARKLHGKFARLNFPRDGEQKA